MIASPATKEIPASELRSGYTVVTKLGEREVEGVTYSELYAFVLFVGDASPYVIGKNEGVTVIASSDGF